MTFQPDTSLPVRVQAACNVEARRGVERPTILLLHYTGMATSEKAVDWLTCGESRVSCHYAIDEHGEITQMVPEALRAWHAGEGVWQGETDINSASIGIEIHNPGHEFGYPDFPEKQIQAVEALSRDIVRRNQIRPERVLGHSDVAPTRKKDPGEKFPWDRMARAGVGHWVEPEPIQPGDLAIGFGVANPLVKDFQLLLRQYGYGVEPTGVLDPKTEFVIIAFQRHFRPARVDGQLDKSSIMTLEKLINALPKDGPV